MPLYEGLSYSGEKTAVVFDFGAGYTKVGFAAENGPRAIVPSKVTRVRSGKVVELHKCSDTEELFGALVDFIHFLYFRHLLANPKERRVVVVESLLTTSTFRNTIAKVLFKHYEVPSVMFVPGHLVALFTLGIPSALVIDAGYSETLVLPVYESTPILKGWQAIPLAGKAIHEYLEAELKESATIAVGQETHKPLTSVLDSLDENILEDIKVKCCFVTKMERAIQLRDVQLGKEGAEMPPPPPDVDYPMDGKHIMHIPGHIREKTCEVLFDQDMEERSVSTLLLDAILQCPMDMRRTLAENIVILGGTAMLPGFVSRLLAELHLLMEQPRYQQELAALTFKIHSPPAKENYTAWLGGAIFGALEVLGSRSVSRDQYQQNPIIPDWCSLYDFEDKDDKIAVAKP